MAGASRYQGELRLLKWMTAFLYTRQRNTKQVTSWSMGEIPTLQEQLSTQNARPT